MHKVQNNTFALIGIRIKKRKLDGNDTRTKLISSSENKAESQSTLVDSFLANYYLAIIDEVCIDFHFYVVDCDEYEKYIKRGLDGWDASLCFWRNKAINQMQ